MKELPYFRFTVQEWQNGGISNLNDSLKGVFIDICAYYWAQNCDLTFELLSNKFKTKSKSIQKLIETQTISNRSGIISISFLNQQWNELKQNKTFFSKMGELGQKAKKSKAPLKPPLNSDLSYKDKDKDKDKDNTITLTQKKPNPIWDSLCENFGLKPVTKSELTSLGALTRDFTLKEADPSSIVKRIRVYKEKFPTMPCTPYALLKNWDFLKPPQPKIYSSPQVLIEKLKPEEIPSQDFIDDIKSKYVLSGLFHILR